MLQSVAWDGDWQTSPGAPQFRAEIPLPGGATVAFEADYPPPMGGTGSAPNPLAYCFWGGLACYAMTYAQEAAREGIELRALHARVETQLDMSRESRRDGLTVTAARPRNSMTCTSFITRPVAKDQRTP